MKRFTVSILSLILVVMTSYGQETGRGRKPAAAGTFYPADAGTLKEELNVFLSSGVVVDKDVITRAVIVPHAGYVYSGKTAGIAYASIDPDADYDRIFLIGTSHRYAFEGAAVYTSGDFITPLGDVTVDCETGKRLEKSSVWFVSRDEVHGPEHSLEVQLPFIQYHFTKKIPVVPILIGTGNALALRSVATALRPYFTDRNLFIISSDFSHYPSYDDAVRVDRLTMEAIMNGDPDQFMGTVKKLQSEGTAGLATAMCGWSSAMVLLCLTSEDSTISFRHLDYSNSGDTPFGDRSQVVGYQAIAAVEEKSAREEKSVVSDPGFTLTAGEKETLLRLAREAVRAALFKTKMPPVSGDELTPVLKQHLGAFVTITIDGQLRGCIGQFMPSEPLYRVVESMAVSAAFSDTRFTPLTREEYPQVEFEISVLGPLKKIKDINEIVIGRHGVYIKKGLYSGTLLPQVPGDRGWTVDEFLGYTARDKAGIGWNGWKDADIYIYEAIVFHE